MYGYIRPIPGELKVREFERFKACYCGLCRTLKEKYGVVSSFVLNYELVFLVMLIWDESSDGEPKICKKRCLASPLYKKAYCVRSDAFEIGAGCSVILAWRKLKDEIADESKIKTIPYRLAALLLRKAYRKAAKEFPKFDTIVKENLDELTRIEIAGNASLDKTADKFAKSITAAVPDNRGDAYNRIMKELLYHTGRWIYVIDALDDYKKDIKKNRYNAAADVYPPKDGEIPAEGARRIETTLTHSNNLVCSAFELLPENPWSQTVRNIIYLGMPYVCRCVLDGSWKKISRRKNKHDNKEWI